MTQPAKSIPLTGVILGWTAPENNHPGRLFLDSDDGPEVVLNFWPEYLPLLQPLGDMNAVAGTRIEAMAKYSETRGTEVRYRPYATKLLEPAPEGGTPTEPRPAPRAPRAVASAEEGMARGNATTAAAAGLFAPWVAQHGDLPPEDVCLEFARRLSLTATAILSARLTETTPQPQAEQPSSVQRL